MRRVLISGASGLIGGALVPLLRSEGFEVVRLVRRQPLDSGEIEWDPMREIPPELVSGFHAVIHLSGETVAGRWTRAKKIAIRDSRVLTTQNLARALARAASQPAAFLCASAIGCYGDRGDEVLTEESPSGDGFLASVCREWEAATLPASEAGTRVVNLRTGIVLSRTAGALKPMLLPFRLGLGGRIGSGRQWWSWIHVSDLASAVIHSLEKELSGPVNLTSPNPVRNSEFTEGLARILSRPAIIPIPAWALRVALGGFADEGALASARVLPAKLMASGFQFRYADLQSALRELV